MGCRCTERTDALHRAKSQLVAGQVRAAGRNLAFVGRTLVQDVRSGDLRRAATQRLAQVRHGKR